jgi:hypothetical protein
MVPTGGFVHTTYDVNSVPAMSGSHARVCAALEDRRIEVSVFLAFWTPNRRRRVKETIIRQPSCHCVQLV